MIYATEDGEADEVVIEEDGDAVDVEIKPGGNSDSIDAAQLLTEKSDEEYGGHHNEHLVALMDLAVGRGRNTPGNTRNGELLQNNRVKVNEDIDWRKVSELEFNLEEAEESAKYRVDVIYQNGEKIDRALTYEEISTYLQGFEELSSVDKRKEEPEIGLPAPGIMAFTSQGMYLNSLSTASNILEASARSLQADLEEAE